MAIGRKKFNMDPKKVLDWVFSLERLSAKVI